MIFSVLYYKRDNFLKRFRHLSRTFFCLFSLSSPKIFWYFVCVSFWGLLVCFWYLFFIFIYRKIICKKSFISFLYALKTNFTIWIFYESLNITQNVLNVIIFFFIWDIKNHQQYSQGSFFFNNNLYSSENTWG